MKCNKTAVSAAAMITVLLFFFAQGAAIIAFELEGAMARLIPALILFVLFAVGFIILRIIKMPLNEAGFRKPREGSLKKLNYLLTLIAVALSGLTGGINLSGGIGYIFACLLYVLAIALSEELFFRGIICSILKEKGSTRAILISAALFGVCHVLQAIGNPDLIGTILAICFAFFYGIAFAQIFLITKSIFPGILIHALHDFCSFIGNELSAELNLILDFCQTALILIFIVIVHLIAGKTELLRCENEKADK